MYSILAYSYMAYADIELGCYLPFVIHSAESANWLARLREGRRQMQSNLYKINLEISRNLWGDLSDVARECLRDLSTRYSLSIASGDLLYLEGRWYVTHAGLLGIARRKRCSGIRVR